MDPQLIDILKSASIFSAPSISYFIASLVFSLIGLNVFRRAKKSSNQMDYLIGLALMFYPYFISDDFLFYSVGIILCGMSYYGRKLE